MQAPLAARRAIPTFALAVIGEEFGLVGVLVVIGLFFWMIRHIMQIGRQSIVPDRLFSGLAAQGVGIWMGFRPSSMWA